MSGPVPSAEPTIAFLCTRNAGRSQMASGFAKQLAGGRVDVYSGGSEPADEINQAVVAAMAEVGVDLSTEKPTRWSEDVLRSADVIVTMGCRDTCPIYPGKRYEDWDVPDPRGLDVPDIRPIRDEIGGRVRALLRQLGIDLATQGDEIG
jgi:arsenate reductase (thioredoxin)